MVRSGYGKRACTLLALCASMLAGAPAHAADTARTETRGEVLVGTVEVSGAAGAATRELAGFATVVDAKGVTARPLALLPERESSFGSRALRAGAVR